MKLEEALIAMIKGERITRSNYGRYVYIYFDKTKRRFMFSSLDGKELADRCLDHKEGYIIWEESHHKISISNIEHKITTSELDKILNIVGG